METFTKKQLESIYSTTLTDDDLEVIKAEMDGISLKDIEVDTRYFSSLSEYVAYRREDSHDFDNNLIELLLWIANNEANNLQKAEDILVDSEDIKLGNGRYILVMG